MPGLERDWETFVPKTEDERREIEAEIRRRARENPQDGDWNVEKILVNLMRGKG